jgi:hypothetical protein
MAELQVDGGDLLVRLSPLEKLGALRGDVRVPLAAVCDIRWVDNLWPELRGVRAPGTGFPGVIALGTRRGPGNQGLRGRVRSDARHRHRP